MCWALSFTLSIALRHTSHKILVFGHYSGTYCRSLLHMYGAYAFTIVASIAVNYIVFHWLQTQHYVAYGSTAIFSGVFNYFVLKSIWKKHSPVQTQHGQAIVDMS